MENQETEKRTIYALKRGNSLQPICDGMPDCKLSAPTIYAKFDEGCEWEPIYACHDGAIADIVWDEIQETYEVLIVDMESPYFSKDEVLSDEDLELHAEIFKEIMDDIKKDRDEN